MTTDWDNTLTPKFLLVVKKKLEMRTNAESGNLQARYIQDIKTRVGEKQFQDGEMIKSKTNGTRQQRCPPKKWRY